jgi:hypothetical protein
LLSARSISPAFHPYGKQKVLDLHPSVFALERSAPNGKIRTLCLHNVSRMRISLDMPYKSATSLFTGQTLHVSQLSLAPYQTLWMKL